MVKFTKRFAELYGMLGIKFEIVNDILWREYQRMIISLGPAILNYTISEDRARYLLLKFPKALLVRWTDGFNGSGKNKDWYAVICDEFKDLDKLSSKNRSKIKRGLKNCVVEMVDAKFIAESGYSVFISAFKRYKRVSIPSIRESDFKKRILLNSRFEDIIHYWGIFHKGQLIAYSENYIFDNIEVSYSTIKFHPDYMKLYPSYALVFTMNKYYLRDQKFEYVNDGFRNILHQTNIQGFLIDKFNFKKAYTNLYVYNRLYLSIYLKISFPIRNVLKKINPKLSALYMMEEIRKKM